MDQLISAFGALGLGSLFGVLLSAWLAGRHEREKRRTEFIKQQLTEFYGPLVSMRAEISARGELRAKIGAAANAAWQEGVAYAREISVQESADFSKRYLPEFSAVTDDENRILREVLMPLYRAMLSLFRDRMWLAEPETRTYFKDFLAFVDIWERWLREAIPGAVIGRVGHTEDDLQSFYHHLVNMHDRLQFDPRNGQVTMARHAWTALRGVVGSWGRSLKVAAGPKK